MRLYVVAVGQRLPVWAETACQTYARRFPPELKLVLRPVKAQTRSDQTVAALQAAERQRIEAALPKGVRRVVLDERGQRVTTRQLADRLALWMGDGRDVALVIGGADGLDSALKDTADDTLRLSDLTLPHALARVLLLEQLYRAWTVISGHPYHRD